MTITYRGYPGPLPSPNFRAQVADEVMAPFQDVISGEFAATTARQLGIARMEGKIKNVILSVVGSGKDDTAANTPRVSGEVTINGVSVFTTKPSIGHISGELAQFKTTFSEESDTGVIQAVINESANTFKPGDIIGWTAIYDGSGSPTTKIKSPGILVEVTPTEG